MRCKRSALTRVWLTTAVLTAVAALPSAAQTLPDDLDAYIEQVRDEFGVVGLSVAVVKDGEVVYASGFGERELGSRSPVDEHSLFAIGSNTKAFTAAGIGILVDEGKIGWDDRVTDHLPWFELFDPYVTREITIRDILSHRSGLGRRGDPNWYATDFDREEIVRRIRYLEPNSSFRSQAGYQNTMFLTAGEVTEEVAGTTWDEWIKSRILRPLGMSRSQTSVKDLGGVENVATPHALVDGELVAIPHRDIDNIAPAGSILSSVEEMSHWLRMMLSEGEFQGTRIVSEEVVREVWTPNIIYPLGPQSRELFPSTHFSTYGLGWGLRDYRGRFIATHTGGIDGMLSQVLLVPEEELGIVVLTNTSPSGSMAQAAITYRIVDAYLGAPDARDWVATFQELAEQQRKTQAAAEERRLESRVTGTSTSLSLDAYTGTYEDEMYGRLTVSLEDGKLVLRRHTAYVGDLEHWHFDTFTCRWRDRVMGQMPLTFNLSASGEVESLELAEVAEFERLPEETTAEGGG